MVVDAPSFEFGFFGGVSCGIVVVIVVGVIVITLSWEGGGSAAAVDWAAVVYQRACFT